MLLPRGPVHPQHGQGASRNLALSTPVAITAPAG